MAKSFNDRYYHEVSTEERLENMTLHKYDARIRERREERKMKGKNSMVIACGHGYHESCFIDCMNEICCHCETVQYLFINLEIN